MKVLKLITLLGIILIIGACAKYQIEEEEPLSADTFKVEDIGPGGGGIIDPAGAGAGDDDSVPQCDRRLAYRNLNILRQTTRANSLLASADRDMKQIKNNINTIYLAQQKILDSLCTFLVEIVRDGISIDDFYCLVNDTAFLLDLVTKCCGVVDVKMPEKEYYTYQDSTTTTRTLVSETESTVTRTYTAPEGIDVTKLGGNALQIYICRIVLSIGEECSLLYNYCLDLVPEVVEGGGGR